MKQHSATLFADDLVFPEAPRWHDDRLWVSDVFDRKLYNLGWDGSRTLLNEVPGRPSGIGFLPDGTPLVVSSEDRKLMKRVDDELVVHADLWDFAAGDLNDFVVDEIGRVYVGNFGFDLMGGAPKALTKLHVVEPDGSIRTVASELEFPNGAVLTHGGRTLVVAETWAGKLTAYDRDADGNLSERRVYADLGHREPDGICIDAEGGIWVACFNTGEFVRVREGGEITDLVSVGGRAVSCELGGPAGTTLFCSAFKGELEEVMDRKRAGELHVVEVEVPRATPA